MINIEEVARMIYSELGPGFSERVYHNAMEVALRDAGLKYETERIITISYKGHVIGNVRADIIIDNHTILEFKTIRTLGLAEELQARNYLRLTGLKVAYLINFPPRLDCEVEVRKVVALPLSEEV